MFAYEKIDGLDREPLLAAIEPVLRAHGVRGVELIWRTDHRGWLLYVTLELDGEAETDAGVTLDLCTDVSRDLSAALDVADVIRPSFRLEVGSPGVERKLYRVEDYERFTGRLAKLKLRAPIEGEYTLRGDLAGVTDGVVAIDTDTGRFDVPFGEIETGNLVLDLQRMGSVAPATPRNDVRSNDSARRNGAANTRR